MIGLQHVENLKRGRFRMSKKYDKLGQDIIEKIGGSENISTFTHCMTRLRFALNDNKKVDQEGIKALWFYLRRP